MKREDDDLQNTAGTESPEPRPAATERAPYRRPVLRHLGSVRELALGSPMGVLSDRMGGLRGR